MSEPRTGLKTFLLLLLEDIPIMVDVPEESIDGGRVTDSNMRECASLGVNLGARSRGLLLCKSNRAPEE